MSVNLQAQLMIEQLEIETLIGCLPSERQKKQTLTVDVHFQYDISAASSYDRLEETIDYVKVTEMIREFAFASDFLLIEAFAAHLYEALKRKFNFTQLALKIYKPSAIAGAKTLAISLGHV